MSEQRKVIITCADHRGDPYADDVAASADHASRDCGAARSTQRGPGRQSCIYTRGDPTNGQPTRTPTLFRDCLSRITAASDVVINITTGGSQTMTVEERLQPALALKPELASLNMGTMNFGLYEMIPR